MFVLNAIVLSLIATVLVVVGTVNYYLGAGFDFKVIWNEITTAYHESPSKVVQEVATAFGFFLVVTSIAGVLL